MKSFVRKITVTAIMSAIATVLMYLEFSVPLMPSFVKFDFSELPALIVSFALGPWWGVVVCLIKNLIKLVQTRTYGVGELANFLIGVSFVLPAGYLYKFRKTRAMALIGSIAGALTSAMISLPLNYYVTYPMYSRFLPIETIIGMYQEIWSGADGLFVCLLAFNVPFTFIKCVIVAAITFLIYKRISPILKGVK